MERRRTGRSDEIRVATILPRQLFGLPTVDASPWLDDLSMQQGGQLGSVYAVRGRSNGHHRNLRLTSCRSSVTVR
jgi:hypothetical protein